MKKIAFAALLTASAAQAQLSLTGETMFGYMSDTSASGDSSGLGAYSTELYIKASEDLGGGWTAVGRMALIGLDRSGESAGNGGLLTGGTAYIRLTHNTGHQLTLIGARDLDYLSGYTASLDGGFNGAGVEMDGKVFEKRRSTDAIAYQYSRGPYQLELRHAEPSYASGTDGGLGQGATGSKGQRENRLRASYAHAQWEAALGLLSYDKRDGSNTTQQHQWRAALAYKTPGVSVGGGVVQIHKDGGAVDHNSLVALLVPCGAWSFSANWANSQRQNTGDNSAGRRSGYGLELMYSLSKRSALVASYSRWTPIQAAATHNTETLLLLAHTF